MRKRIIKNISNYIKPHESNLHPNTLHIIVNNDKELNMCASKLHLEDNKFENTSFKCTNTNIGELVNLLSIPSVIVNYDYILDVYNIESINDLLLFIKTSINTNNSFNFINRCVNAWIRINYNDLITSYKILLKINYIIFNFFFKYLIISKKIFYKDLKKFIPYWFENNNNNDFNLNLAIEIKKYLDKKYEQ